jgi:hypothetical protein
MQADIRPIDIRLPAEQEQLNLLLNAIFGFELQGNDVWLNTRTGSTLGEPLYLGAFDGEKLIGFNAYIAHDCVWKGEEHVFYQSCWSAVSPQYRGKRLFYRLQTEARQPLRAQGALGILGLPNEQSGPILTGPLAYENHGGYLRKTLLMPEFFPGVNRHFKSSSSTLTPDIKQLLSLKQQQHNRKILCYEDKKGNLLWGKFAKVKKGNVKLSHFLVGGVQLTENADFRQVVRASADKFNINLMTFLYHQSADYAQLFGRGKPSDSGYLCWYPLHARREAIRKFNFWVGLSDVF